MKLLEIFKGTGSVGKVAKKMEFNDIVSIDFDPIYTPTIETDILNWDYKSRYATECMGRPADGITNCDIILKNYQDRILRGEINSNVFRWYCWNGTRNQCENNKWPLTNNRNCRNTGIVFQNTEFESSGSIV